MRIIRSNALRYLIILLLCYAAWVALYFLTGWIGDIRGAAFEPRLDIDGVVPFIPQFQYLYMLCYVVVLGILLISRDPAYLNRAFLAFIGANLFAFVFFALFPTQGPPRTALTGDSGFLLALVQGLDSRWNALPSLHVTNPWLVALFALREKGLSPWSAIFFLIAVGISASTLFVMQHYLLDVIAGMALAILSYIVVEYLDVGTEPWRFPWEKAV